MLIPFFDSRAGTVIRGDATGSFQEQHRRYESNMLSFIWGQLNDNVYLRLDAQSKIFSEGIEGKTVNTVIGLNPGAKVGNRFDGV